jgi:hypothetical protein
MITIDKLESIGKETVVASCKLPSLHSPKATEENQVPFS